MIGNLLARRPGVPQFVVPRLVASFVLLGAFVCASALDYPVRIARATNYGKAYTNIGRAAFEKGAYLRAVRVLTAAIERGGGPDAFKMRGRAYWFLDRPKAAISDLIRYLKRRPSDAGGRIWLGDAYNFDFEHAKAINDYNEALRLDPASTEAYLGRGIAYAALEMYPQAIKDFRQFLKSHPHSVDGLINTGVACMLAGSGAKGIQYLRQALDTGVDPDWNKRVTSWIDVLQERVDKGEITIGSLRDDSAHDADAKGKPDILEEAKEQAVVPPLVDVNSTPQEKTPGQPESVTTTGTAHLRANAGRTPIIDEIARDRQSDILPENVTRTWSGSYLGATIDLQVTRRMKRITGVLRIRYPFGKEDSYHFQGRVNKGQISARHASGHLFRGRISGDGRLVGTVTTREGRSLDVDLFTK